MADLQYPPSSQLDADPSPYIDYEAFLAPDFDAAAFANALVLATNDPSDPTSGALDLATPLSRVLFDIQEIDAHIDLLTSRAAVPLLDHTRSQTAASTRLVADLQPQMDALTASYRQLERQVLQRHAEADTVRQTALRLWSATRLGRTISRCLQLGRQLEAQHAELLLLGGDGGGAANRHASSSSGGKATVGDHRAFVPCAYTILSLREIVQQQTAPGDEGHGLDQVNVVRSLQATVVVPIERTVRDAADRSVRDFSLGGGASLTESLPFARAEEVKARTTSALVALYLLSPTPAPSNATSTPWSPALLIQSLETFLRAALQSSISTLARALASLPTLDRALAEVSARCQNIVALEAVLAATKTPVHPLVAGPSGPGGSSGSGGSNTPSLLHVVLSKLETSSLASYFWRSLASSLSPRVQDLMIRGGVVARTLRTNKASLSEAIQACVVRGMTGSTAPRRDRKTEPQKTGQATGRGWEREIAVMVGSVTGHLGR